MRLITSLARLVMISKFSVHDDSDELGLMCHSLSFGSVAETVVTGFGINDENTECGNDILDWHRLWASLHGDGPSFPERNTLTESVYSAPAQRPDDVTANGSDITEYLRYASTTM